MSLRFILRELVLQFIELNETITRAYNGSKRHVSGQGGDVVFQLSSKDRNRNGLGKLQSRSGIFLENFKQNMKLLSRSRCPPSASVVLSELFIVFCHHISMVNSGHLRHCYCICMPDTNNTRKISLKILFQIQWLHNVDCHYTTAQFQE